jgi:hypothetical protein
MCAQKYDTKVKYPDFIQLHTPLHTTCPFSFFHFLIFEKFTKMKEEVSPESVLLSHCFLSIDVEN